MKEKKRMVFIPWLLTVLWMAFIFYMGGPRFGRSGTQQWIDRLDRDSQVHSFFHRHHGAFRAGFHYVEFSTLTVLVFWSLSCGEWTWSFFKASITLMWSGLYAWIDELHQAQTPGRQFRRIDLCHSLLGVLLAMVGIYFTGIVFK